MPKEEIRNEGQVVYNFLNMFTELPIQPRMKRVETKRSFLKTLEFSKENIIHISTHGGREKDTYYIDLPDGEIYAEDFKGFDFGDVQIAITGCLLGRSNFAGNITVLTKCKGLLVPFNEISFIDSAMFCILFYYHLFTRSSLSFKKSYDWVIKRLHVRGAFRLYWG